MRSRLSQGLRDALLQNLGLKAIAFVLALGFFVYFHGQEDLEQRTVPVPVISLPPAQGSRELMSKLPPSIQVTLSGSTRSITKLIREGMAPVAIDLRDGSKQSVAFTRSMFLLPDDIELVAIVPPRLELDWEDVVTRQVPIQASFIGQPAEGHTLRGEPIVEPPRVTVKGPVSRVEVMQFARLAPFDLSGLREGRFPRRLSIEPPPEQVRYLGSQTATVTVEVSRRRAEKVFVNRPVMVVGPASGVVVPRTVDVTVLGLPELVKSLRDEQVVPQVNLEFSGYWVPGAGHGSATVPVTVILAGAQVEVQPPSVMVRW
ncbi:MAG TPA: CdaR family protein [Polyangiaceae bacterium]|nr:CdaR family protein [Polyangiaceae bacterium]